MASFSLPVSVTNRARSLLKSIPPLRSWKMLALVLILINLKSLPFVWHLRVLYNCARHLRLRPSAHPGCEPILTASGPTHPIFTPTSYITHTSLLETDYNMHKSNSTYFTDLDVARCPLVTRVYSPGMGITSREIDAEFKAEQKRQALNSIVEDGKKKLPPPGRVAIVLGSVYCSFKREIRPYERFEIRSKVVSWDNKWLYMLSWYIRSEKRKGEEKTILAIALSKYVAKKGRLTVKPERVLRNSGLLPPRPVDSEETDSSSRGTSTPSSDPSSGDEGVDGTVMREVLNFSEAESSASTATLSRKRDQNEELWNQGGWTWERIESERLRGLKLMEAFMGLDTGLDKEMEL